MPLEGGPSLLAGPFKCLLRRPVQIFKNCGGFEVELKRVVKQGDPLSSILFNMLHDPLLERLEDQG